jgi:hypothetical protein
MQRAPATFAAMRDELFAPRPIIAVMTELRITLFIEWKLLPLLLRSSTKMPPDGLVFSIA